MNILKGDKIMGDEVYEKKIKLLSQKQRIVEL